LARPRRFQRNFENFLIGNFWCWIGHCSPEIGHPDAPGLRMPELIFGDLFGKDNGAGGQAPVRAMFASSANAPPCNEGARGTHRAAGSLDRGDDLVSADGFPDRQREIFSHWE
jgi:hypothetical protein